jgi:hypothetical protein
MRISRLFQRAGAIGAASVALFVSLIAPVHASTAAQVNVYGVDTVRNADGAFEARYHFQRRFAANDPVYPGKVDYVTRRVKVPKRGNPVKWVKRTPLEAGVIVAVAAAGWAIDDLTGQITKPSAATGSVSDHEPGYYYKSNNSGIPHCISPEHCYVIAPPSVQYFSNTFPRAENGTIVVYGRDSPAVYYRKGGAYQVVSWSKTPCSTSLSICQVDPDNVPLPVVPEPVSVPEAWDIINPVANAAPDHHLSPWVKDAAGNPYIYPEVQAEQAKIAEGVPGAQRLPDAVVVTDPLAGRGLGIDGQPTGDPVPTPNVSVSSPPVDFPDDYAREDTLSEQKNAVVELRDLLKEEFDTEPDFTG